MPQLFLYYFQLQISCRSSNRAFTYLGLHRYSCYRVIALSA